MGVNIYKIYNRTFCMLQSYIEYVDTTERKPWIEGIPRVWHKNCQLSRQLIYCSTSHYCSFTAQHDTKLGRVNLFILGLPDDDGLTT